MTQVGDKIIGSIYLNLKLSPWVIRNCCTRLVTENGLTNEQYIVTL